MTDEKSRDIQFQRARARGRSVHLPLIVSIPLLIGLLVLTTGILNKNILSTTVLNAVPESSRGQVEESLKLLSNLTYLSAALAAVAGLLLAFIIIRPIRRLSVAMAALAHHGIASEVDFTRTGTEIGELGESFNRVMGMISNSMPERARFLFHSIASGLMAFDGEGVFTMINSAADKMLELNGVGVRNRTVSEFLGGFGQMDELIALLERSRIEEVDSSGEKVRVRTASGREIHLMVTTVTLSDPHSGRREILATLMDLSRVRQINEQMQQSDKLSSLGTLAAGVAHEIRNPLASLRGLTQLLAEDLGPEDPKHRYAKVILGEVDRLNSVVQQLLDFSAVSREEKARTDLNSLIRNALQLAKPALKKKPEVRVELQLAELLPPVGVYERKIVQALLNLILNAIEAVDDRGTVRIATRTGKGRIEVEIANTGSYIEPEQRERIFDPFFTTKDGGTGLGLAITHQIARQHDGSIEVRSFREEGTAFILSIPDKSPQDRHPEGPRSGGLSSSQPQRL